MDKFGFFLAGCLCGGIIVVVCEKNKVKLKNLMRKMTSSVDVGKIKQIGRATIDEAEENVSKAFYEYADIFQGLYEPMYLASNASISKERMLNVLKEWNIRLKNTSNMPAILKGWWDTITEGYEQFDKNRLERCAAEVIKVVEHSGIIRDNRKIITADEKTMLYYQSLTDDQWEIGHKLNVEKPSWYINTTPVRVMEKGYCVIIK